MFSSRKKSEIRKAKNKKIFEKKQEQENSRKKKQQQQCVSTVRRVVKSKKRTWAWLNSDLGHALLFLNTYDQRVPRH